MRNYIQPGKSITLNAPYAVASGAGMLVGGANVSGTWTGGIFGIAEGPAAINTPVVVRRVGVFTMPKATGAIAIGQALYWDDTNKVLTTTSNSGANKMVGDALTAQLSADVTVQVILAGRA